MNVILIFLGICLVLGLWVKPRSRFGPSLIAVLAFLLVIIFWLYPSLF